MQIPSGSVEESYTIQKTVTFITYRISFFPEISPLDPQFFHSLCGVDRLPRCLRDVGWGESSPEPEPHARASRCMLDIRELVCVSRALGTRECRQSG